MVPSGAPGPSSGQRLRGPTPRCTCCGDPTDEGRRWAAVGYPDSGPSTGHSGYSGIAPAQRPEDPELHACR